MGNEVGICSGPDTWYVIPEFNAPAPNVAIVKELVKLQLESEISIE
jgi:hypothetical protein